MLDRRTFLVALTAIASLVSAPAAEAADHTRGKPSKQRKRLAGRSWSRSPPPGVRPARPRSRCSANCCRSTQNLAVFEVDFDSQKDIVRAFDARMQSTLITVKGATEVGRLVGVTKADAIKQLLDKTI